MDESNDPPLPPPLDLLWDRRPGAERPRQHGLTVEALVAAAIEIADADGLGAVSMSRVAERLGYTTMAPYRHVRSKQELVALMVEAATAEPSPEVERAGDWRAALERWSWELLGVVRGHPWLLSVPLSTTPFGPRRLSWLDRGLGALAGTPLTEDDKAAVILLLNSHVFSEARLAAELAAGVREDGVPETAVSDPMPSLVDSERFPALRRAVDAGIFDPSGSDPDHDFTFGLARILDGVERLVTERRR